MTTIGSRAPCGAAVQRGVTLLEMMIVLAVAALMLATLTMELRYLSDNNTTTNLAMGLDRVYTGARAYLARNYNTLSREAQPVVPGFNDPMQPTVAELKAAHFLGHSTSAEGYTGGRWQVRIRPANAANCPGPDCNLDLLVYLDRPLTRDGRPALNLAAGAAIKAHVPAGFSGLAPHNARMTGLQRSWSVRNPVSNRPAVLGALGSLTAQQQSIYLLRSGALPMQGDLQMTDEKGQAHSIDGVANLNAKGSIYASEIRAGAVLESDGTITAREQIVSAGQIHAGTNLIANGLIITGEQVRQIGEQCDHAGALAQDRFGTVFTCSPVPGNAGVTTWEPIKPASGTLCGMARVKGLKALGDKKITGFSLCKGMNPAMGCPAGYERSHFYDGTATTDIYVCIAR